MDDEILIEEVRQYDELYDMSHKKYSDNQHKNLIWVKIGQKLNSSGPLCKNRWISLRDQLRKALKNKKTKSGQAAVVQKKWKYEDSMTFLIPYFKQRETLSNISPSESFGVSEESNDEDITQLNNEELEIEHGITPKRKMKASPKIIPKKNNKAETASSVLMKYIIDSEKNESKETSRTPPIDSFFHGLASTVKTFSPEYQHIAKSRFFSIVSDLEWAQLQNKQITSSTHRTTSGLTSDSMNANLSVLGAQNSLPYGNSHMMTPLQNSSPLYAETPTPSPTSELAPSTPQCTQNVNIQNKAPEYSTSYLGSDLYKNAVPETQCSLPYYGNRLIKPKTPLQYSSALHIQTTTTETITSSPPSAQHFYGNFNG